ncbi:MAG: endosialidase [Lachnospiraceae bacterium]|nr:endosialidase [Lachnospiraceae bacterium]
MAVVEELIRTENNETLSFGNYRLDTKSKVDNFEFGGDLYKVKTFKEITKLERNGMFVYESVPGTTVSQLHVTDSGVDFKVEGPEDAQITLELEEQSEYEVTVNGVNAGHMKTNLGGKLSLSVELSEDTPVAVQIEKIG